MKSSRGRSAHSPRRPPLPPSPLLNSGPRCADDDRQRFRREPEPGRIPSGEIERTLFAAAATAESRSRRARAVADHAGRSRPSEVAMHVNSLARDIVPSDSSRPRGRRRAHAVRSRQRRPGQPSSRAQDGPGDPRQGLGRYRKAGQMARRTTSSVPFDDGPRRHRRRSQSRTRGRKHAHHDRVPIAQVMTNLASRAKSIRHLDCDERQHRRRHSPQRTRSPEHARHRLGQCHRSRQVVVASDVERTSIAVRASTPPMRRYRAVDGSSSLRTLVLTPRPMSQVTIQIVQRTDQNPPPSPHPRPFALDFERTSKALGAVSAADTRLRTRGS